MYRDRWFRATSLALAVAKARESCRRPSQPPWLHRPRPSDVSPGATGISTTLPHSRLADAAYAGLQDTVSRAGLLSLHVRIEDIGPHDWEESGLAQAVLRRADYIIPRSAISAFTLWLSAA